MTRTRLVLILLSLIALAPRQAVAAEAFQVNSGNASRLPKGMDAYGGVGDWYLGNDRIAVVIDDISNPNLLAPTGGWLLDAALIGEDNDQLLHLLQVNQLDVTGFFENGSLAPPIPVTAGNALDKECEVHQHGNGMGCPCGSGLARELFKLATPKLIPRSIRARTTVNHAELVVTAALNSTDGNVTLTTTYSLEDGWNYLKMVSVADGKPGMIFGDVVYLGIRGMAPFGPYHDENPTTHEVYGAYNHKPASSIAQIAQAIRSYSPILLTGQLDKPVSYALWLRTDGLWNTTLPGFTGIFNDGQVSSLYSDLLSATVYGGKNLQGNYEYERYLVIGDWDDIASVTDTVYQLEGLTTGTLEGQVNLTLDPRSVLIMVRTNDDPAVPVTTIRPRSDGSFRADLEAGKSYQLEVLFRNEARQELGPYAIASGQVTTVPPIDQPDPIVATVTILDENGDAIPAKITFEGMNGTANPKLEDDMIRFTMGGSMVDRGFRFNYVYTGEGPEEVHLPPGSYRLTATRGMEYTADVNEVVWLAGTNPTVTFHLRHVVDTSGWIGSDFHVHSGPSFDSGMSLEDRVRQIIAENVEVIVSTEHDIVYDYDPTIQSMGVGNWVRSYVGVEETGMVPYPGNPFTVGHNNAWPLTFDPTLPRNGTPPDEFMELGGVYENLRAAGAEVIQMNHPRDQIAAGVGLGYFTNIWQLDSHDEPEAVGFQPDKNVTDAPNNILLKTGPLGTKNIDFDTWEVLNGADPHSAVVEYDTVKRDWFSLLLQGYKKPGTAVSDSHIPDHVMGYAKTYVLVPSDRTSTLRTSIFNQEVKDGHMVGSSGLFLTASVNGMAPFETAEANGGTVTMHLKLQKAPWVPCEELRLYQGGVLVKVFGIEDFNLNAVVVYEGDYTFQLRDERDTFLYAEAGMKGLTTDTEAKAAVQALKQSHPIWTSTAPSTLPIAFVNPIFLSADGVNGYQAPGKADCDMDGKPDFMDEDANDDGKSNYENVTTGEDPLCSAVPTPTPTATMAPEPPSVLVAGYMDTALSVANGGAWSIIALTQPQTVDAVEIFYLGTGTGVFLASTGDGAFTTYIGPFGPQVLDGLQGRYLFELQATDGVSGLHSALWPYLTVE